MSIAAAVLSHRRRSPPKAIAPRAATYWEATSTDAAHDKTTRTGNFTMKTLLALGALTATSAMYALPATAGCVDPRNPEVFSGISHSLAAAVKDHGIGNPHDSIVGTWLVSYTTVGTPPGQAFIQWHSDGTEWEEINHPILSGNICLGSWKVIDPYRYFRNHVGWLYENGALIGYLNETETDELSKDGNSYTGTNEVKLYDLSGNLFFDATGTASATRIAP
jgi:hypothetical protein